MNYITIIIDDFIPPSNIIPELTSATQSQPVEAIWLSHMNIVSLTIAFGEDPLSATPRQFNSIPIHQIPNPHFHN